jgi:hypothetical protein
MTFDDLLEGDGCQPGAHAPDRSLRLQLRGRPKLCSFRQRKPASKLDFYKETREKAFFFVAEVAAVENAGGSENGLKSSVKASPS